MSVLESMQSGSDSSFMQVVLALVVVSFIGWYASPQGERSTLVATVNGVKILDTAYTRRYRSELRNAEARYGRTMSNEEQAAIGEQVRQALIEDEVVLQEARRIGLAVSDKEIARFIVDQPYLKDKDGKFSKDLLTRFLKRNQWTRADYEDDLRKQMLRQKLRVMVFTGASASDAELRQAWTEQNTSVDLKYVKVSAREFSDDVIIEDGQIEKYLVENELEVKARYDRDFQRRWNKPEMFRLRFIRQAVTEEADIATVTAQMNALREQIAAGADMAAIAAASSDDPSAENGGELEPRALTQLGGPDAEDVKKLTAGNLGRVFSNADQTDVRLYRLEELIPAEVIAFDDAKAEIAEEMIRQEGGPALAAAFAEEELLPAWVAAGAPPKALIEANGLIDLSTGERSVQAQPGNPFDPPADLLNAARSADIGTVFDKVYENQGVLWVAQLLSRTDPDAALYESQKATLSEPVLMNKRNEFFTEWVDDTKSRARIH